MSTEQLSKKMPMTVRLSFGRQPPEHWGRIAMGARRVSGDGLGSKQKIGTLRVQKDSITQTEYQHLAHPVNIALMFRVLLCLI